MKANIVAIKRFAVHDGDGIRTTVVFKGCPLQCRWCHNPETLSPQRRLAFYAHKCVGCGACARLCSCHAVTENGHTVDRNNCTACGKCAAVCPQDALEVCGTKVDTEEICAVLLRDKAFYAESGGGITLSGGECLLQSEACRAILQKMKQNGIHTAVDTCGFVSRAALDRVLPYTDLFLYDIKAIDERVHIRCTGQSNTVILENLTYLSARGAKSEIRVPYVPDYNDGEMGKIKAFLSALDGVTKVIVLPYHNCAASKYAALAMENTLPEKLPSADGIAAAEALLNGR